MGFKRLSYELLTTSDNPCRAPRSPCQLLWCCLFSMARPCHAALRPVHVMWSVATFLIQEMARKTLEELSGEIYRHDGIVPNESKAVTEGDAAEEAKSGTKA